MNITDLLNSLPPGQRISIPSSPSKWIVRDPGDGTPGTFVQLQRVKNDGTLDRDPIWFNSNRIDRLTLIPAPVPQENNDILGNDDNYDEAD